MYCDDADDYMITTVIASQRWDVFLRHGVYTCAPKTWWEASLIYHMNHNWKVTKKNLKQKQTAN